MEIAQGGKRMVRGKKEKNKKPTGIFPGREKGGKSQSKETPKSTTRGWEFPAIPEQFPKEIPGSARAEP